MICSMKELNKCTCAQTRPHTGVMQRGNEREVRMKPNLRTIVLSCGIVAATAIAVHGQTGLLMKAVGGYSFEQAVKEAPETKNFHSRDGKLTFAIVTHT